MTDHVWTKVDELAASLQDTDAFRALQEARTQVEEREAARIMLRDLRQLQAEIEEKQAAGEPVGEELTHRLQQRVELVSLNPYVRDYLAAEAAFAQLLLAVQLRLAERLGLSAGEGGQKASAAGAAAPGGAVKASAEGSQPDQPSGARRSSRLWVPR